MIIMNNYSLINIELTKKQFFSLLKIVRILFLIFFPILFLIELLARGVTFFFFLIKGTINFFITKLKINFDTI